MGVHDKIDVSIKVLFVISLLMWPIGFYVEPWFPDSIKWTAVLSFTTFQSAIILTMGILFVIVDRRKLNK
jgi:hypothetical protein